MKLATSTVFILGRYPQLSIAEITAVLIQQDIEYAIVFQNKKVLLIESKNKIDAKYLQDTLGGTVKIGKIVEKFPKSQSNIEDYLTSSELFVHFLPNVSARIQFGISVYSENNFYSLRDLKALTQTLKNHLDSQGFKSRFPSVKEHELSTVSVTKNKLLTEGAEVLIIETEKDLYLASTLTVQNFQSYSDRDYGRPIRDMESGIMPPKIAQAMINLSDCPRSATLLDPFCGSGTILAESLLLGFTDVIGIDISKKAITDTKENLHWLKTQHKFIANAKVMTGDATAVPFKSNTIAAIVCEPYMGPNVHKNRQPIHTQTIIDELEILYKKAWVEYYRVLRQGGNVVMILPVFNARKTYLYTNLDSFIQELGFKRKYLSDTERKSLLIGNDRDFVLREIVQYKK